MVTEDRILAIAKQIKEKVKPSSIYLFGSYAYGTPNENSDIDFMVVKDILHNPRKELVDLKMEIMSKDVSIDVVLISTAELKKRQAEGWTFYEEVLGKGKLLNV
jgi:predicted nucleotidyltransferase